MAKKKLQLTVKEEILKWIDEQVTGLRFASRSHAVEYAIQQLMADEEDLPQIIPDDSMG